MAAAQRRTTPSHHQHLASALSGNAVSAVAVAHSHGVAVSGAAVAAADNDMDMEVISTVKSMEQEQRRVRATLRSVSEAATGFVCP